MRIYENNFLFNELLVGRILEINNGVGTISDEKKIIIIKSFPRKGKDTRLNYVISHIKKDVVYKCLTYPELEEVQLTNNLKYDEHNDMKYVVNIEKIEKYTPECILNEGIASIDDLAFIYNNINDIKLDNYSCNLK